MTSEITNDALRTKCAEAIRIRVITIEEGVNFLGSKFTDSVDMKARFLRHVQVRSTNECWEWRGYIERYGEFSIFRKRVAAHRMSFFLFNGGLTKDQVVRHTCDNPICVNPSHLLSGTQSDNMRDMLERGRQVSLKKTHCKWGHAFTPENIQYRPSKTGGKPQRTCGTCHRIYTANRRAALRASSPRDQAIAFLKVRGVEL